MVAIKQYGINLIRFPCWYSRRFWHGRRLPRTGRYLSTIIWFISSRVSGPLGTVAER